MLYTHINRKGKSLFEEWLEQIEHREPSIYHKIYDILQHMENNDLPMDPPNVRRMAKRTGNRSLFKIRVGKYRLFFLVKNDEHYLLHVFRKSSQTTPEKEIKQVLREVKEATFRPVAFTLSEGEIIFAKV